MIYYIDSINGLDTNDGLTETTPLKTFDKFKVTEGYSILKHGDVIKIKRGSKFNDGTVRLYTQNGGRNIFPQVLITAYGAGEMPEFSAYNELSKTALVSQGQNIYKADLTTLTDGFDTTNYNVGFIYDKVNDKIYGNRVFTQTFEENMDFYVDGSDLYVRIDDYSSLPDDLILGISEIPFVCDSNLIVDSMHFTLSGRHGCITTTENGCDNIEIRNCKFSKIGGALYQGTQRFGNGFECYELGKNIRVHNCVFDDIYDTPVTFQGVNGKFEDISFDHNFFKNCTMVFEGWISGGDGIYNCRFSDNVAINVGYGFGNTHRELGRFVVYQPIADVDHVDIKIENNIFYNTKNSLFNIDNFASTDIKFNNNKYYAYSDCVILDESQYTMANYQEYVNAMHQDEASEFIVIDEDNKGKVLEEILISTTLQSDETTAHFEDESSPIVLNNEPVEVVAAQYGISIIASTFTPINRKTALLKVIFSTTDARNAYDELVRIAFPTNSLNDQAFDDKFYITRTSNTFFSLQCVQNLASGGQYTVSGIVVFNS